MQDVSFVSMNARPGRPNLEQILRDEVEHAQGSLIVACCGPASFNAMVRKAVAKQIDPEKVRKGDARGYIDLISEEFEF
ncbi:hypothetical protein MPER_07072 [Moniliophthora perniciosa FA553]|nr:hypothetical protein MPER_07072 [Moniliophthora perniciosa FA553]